MQTILLIILLSLTMLTISACQNPNTEIEKAKLSEARMERESKARLDFDRHKFDARIELCKQFLNKVDMSKRGVNCNVN